MIDILYLAKGRPEFTRASAEALLCNTDWIGAEASLTVYTDGTAPDRISSIEPLCQLGFSEAACRCAHYGGPVAIMNHFLSEPGSDIFVKLDNDVIVPPGWLERGLRVMDEHPELDLLGIEPPASRTPAPHSGVRRVPAPEEGLLGAGYARCDSIGGIGFMRRSAFANRAPMKPYADGRGGFGDWQLQNKDVVKGWIVPPLNVFLLDRLPMEPYASLSKKYIAEGIQRPWTQYPDSAKHLWEWWLR